MSDLQDQKSSERAKSGSMWVLQPPDSNAKAYPMWLIMLVLCSTTMGAGTKLM